MHDLRTKRFIRYPSGDKNEYLSRPMQFLATTIFATDLLDVNAAAVFIFHFIIIAIVVVVVVILSRDDFNDGH